MYDKMGRTIEVGDRIAYAGSVSNTAELKLGTVKTTSEESITVRGDGNHRDGTLRHPSRIIILEKLLAGIDFSLAL